MDKCIKCGGTMVGDGYTTALHCEFVDMPEGTEADAPPTYCDYEEPLEVILVWYHNGFTDDSPELVAVCFDTFASNRVMQEKDKARDIEEEYRERARIWIERRELVLS